MLFIDHIEVDMDGNWTVVRSDGATLFVAANTSAEDRAAMLADFCPPPPEEPSDPTAITRQQLFDGLESNGIQDEAFYLITQEFWNSCALLATRAAKR